MMKTHYRTSLLVMTGLLLTASLFAADAQPSRPVITMPDHPRVEVGHHLTLAPSTGNRRNSEGDFVQLKDGRWRYIYTHFTGGSSDHAAAFLASRESTDGGLTWSTNDTVVVSNEGGFNIMSVSLVRLKSGEIALFYLRKNSMYDCRPVMRISRDEAKTWGEPIECITDIKGYYVVNNARVLQLEDGRLIIPSALHDFEKGRLQPGRIVNYISDDGGTTWRRGRSVLETDADGTRVSLMEPGIVEVGGGRLLMLIRTRLGCQYVSESVDRGETWSTPRPSDLLSPESPATLARIPNTGDLLVVWNDHCNQPEAVRRLSPPIRTPLAAAISKDGGKTWGPHLLIESLPNHGYCYTAVRFANGRVLLGHCAHASAYGLETTQISSFSIEELYKKRP